MYLKKALGISDRKLENIILTVMGIHDYYAIFDMRPGLLTVLFYIFFNQEKMIDRRRL